MKINEIIITQITDVLTVFSPKNRLETTTNRANFGLSFTRDGQITYTHNGKKYISDRNHVVILPKGQNYSIHGDKTGTFPVINFNALNVPDDKISIIPINNIDSIYNDFEQMKKLFFFKEQNFAVMSIFYNMLHTLSYDEDLSFNPLISAITYLENNYSSDITNKILANQCMIGEENFRKLFKKTYGVSPKQYVVNIRIRKAKQLLKEGAFKINSIAEMCGFSNQYHFCRIFKQKTGRTPSEYMKNNYISKI